MKKKHLALTTLMTALIIAGGLSMLPQLRDGEEKASGVALARTPSKPLVPVITAVHGFCVGGGIGLAGNSDILIATKGTKFALPEVDRGALGAATHLARLVPPLKMRAMVLTCEAATAEELHNWGSVYAVVEQDELADKAREVARTFTKKIPRVVRVAKECLNNIDPVDVNRSYRIEQGFTFELNLAGVADEARDAFVEKRDPDADEK